MPDIEPQNFCNRICRNAACPLNMVHIREPGSYVLDDLSGTEECKGFDEGNDARGSAGESKRWTQK